MEEDQQQILANYKLILEKILEATEIIKARLKDKGTSLNLQSEILTATNELKIQKTIEVEEINSKTEDFKEQQVQCTENLDNQTLIASKEFTIQKTTEAEESNTKIEGAKDQQVQPTENLDNQTTTIKLDMTFYLHQKKPEEEDQIELKSKYGDLGHQGDNSFDSTNMHKNEVLWAIFGHIFYGLLGIPTVPTRSRRKNELSEGVLWKRKGLFYGTKS